MTTVALDDEGRLVEYRPDGTVFVNADEIARLRWPDDPEAKSYEAAQVAAQTRQSPE